jgi:hypothetical protein
MSVDNGFERKVELVQEGSPFRYGKTSDYIQGQRR